MERVPRSRATEPRRGASIPPFLIMNTFPITCALAAVAAAGLQAQTQTLLFSTTAPERAFSAVGLEVSNFRPGEIQQFVPGTDLSARPFLTDGTQWVYIGDANGNGRIVDDATNGPGQFTDAIFVRRAGVGAGERSQREVWLSKSSTTGFSTSLEDGSVFRYNAQNQTEIFVTEDQLIAALGQPSNQDLDLDAICQDSQGNLYVSFETTESVSGTNAFDGSIIRIPSSAITYNIFNGRVSQIASGSAQILVEESTLAMWISNSGVQTSAGNNPSTNVNVTGLEIDPDGGTFMTSVGTAPNLLFTWSASTNDGAILSSRNGGSLGSINGQPMASAVQTLGTQIGLAPDTQGLDGLSGIALAPGVVPASVVTEVGPQAVLFISSQLYVRQEILGATPNGTVAAFIDLNSGAQFSSLTFPSINGEIFGRGTPLAIGTATADSNGYATFQLPVPSSVFAGSNRFALAFQAVDFGSLSTALPAALQIN